MEAQQIERRTFVPFTEGYIPSSDGVLLMDIVRRAAPEHYSDEMIYWGLAGYVQFFEGNQVACEMTINLADEHGKDIYPSHHEQVPRKLGGILLNPKLASVKDVKRNPPISMTYARMLHRLKSTTLIVDGAENDAFEAIGEALLRQETIADARKRGMHATQYDSTFCPQLHVNIFNPTQERLAEASRAYRHFAEFVTGHANEVLNAAQLLYGALKLELLAKNITSTYGKDSEEATRHLGQSASDLEARASEIIARMNPPDTGLQNYMVN